MSDQSELAIESWEQIEQIIESDNAEHLAVFLQLLPPEETAYTISHLDDEMRTRMLSMLSSARPQFAADLMEHFADEFAAEMIEELEPREAAVIVDQMDSDEQTDILGELNKQDAEAILDQMDPEEAVDARQRLRYDPETAGGIMITEYLAYRQDQDVDDVIEDLRLSAETRDPRRTWHPVPVRDRCGGPFHGRRADAAPGVGPPGQSPD